MKLWMHLYQVGGPERTHEWDAASYLLKGADGWYLLDCGTPEGYELLKERIGEAGVKPEEIRGILGTHGHYDHVGAAGLWYREFGTRLYLHQLDRKTVESGDGERSSSALLYGKPMDCCQVHGNLEDGQTIPICNGRMEVLHTPGHTPGSVCFLLICRNRAGAEQTMLVAGDTLWGGFSIKIGSDEDQWRASIAKLRRRNIDYYTFGHIPPVLLDDANERIREAEMAFANYYNPWFKTFYEAYKY